MFRMKRQYSPFLAPFPSIISPLHLKIPDFNTQQAK